MVAKKGPKKDPISYKKQTQKGPMRVKKQTHILHFIVIFHPMGFIIFCYGWTNRQTHGQASIILKPGGLFESGN